MGQSAPEYLTLRYKYHLRVSDSRARKLQEVFDTCRFIWNHLLGQWQTTYRETGERYTSQQMFSQLTDWRGEHDWLSAVPVTPQQQIVRELDKTTRSFMSGKTGYPKFKKKGKHNTAQWTTRGFRVTGTGLGIKGDKLSLALPGGRVELPVVWSRPLPSEPSSVTVYRCSEGHWWASFVVRVPVEHVDIPEGTSTGLDVGLTTLVTASTPEWDVPNPRFAKKEIKQLQRLDQQLSRGRNNGQMSEKTRKKRVKLLAKIARCRKDYFNKTTRPIARSFVEIGVEGDGLHIQNMMKNRMLAYSIGDAGIRAWLSTLEHQRRKIGRTVTKVPAAGTTQDCSDCGAKAKPRMTLRDRVYNCRVCGMVKPRDRNSAHNLQPGRAKPGNTLTTINPVDASVLVGSASVRIPQL